MAIIHSDAYIPYAERPAYADLEPIPQADAEACLVPIMYSAEYADASGIVRALIAKGERSERVLEVTEHVIRMNPAHYSVWQYRFDTLVALDADWAAELRLMDEFAQDNLKSYQVWHHRLLCHTRLSPARPRAEIDFIHAALQLDTKNYHTWAYLHWTYSHFSTLVRTSSDAAEDAPGREAWTGRIAAQDWAEELRWVERLLDEDGRNNSAWAWRYFLAFSRPGAQGGDEEREYACEMIRKIPHNLSAWNYLRGVHRTLGLSLEASSPFVQPFASATSSATSSADASAESESPRPVPFAVEWLADVAVERGDVDAAVAGFSALRDTLDPMRASYWNHRIKQATRRSAPAESLPRGAAPQSQAGRTAVTA